MPSPPSRGPASLPPRACAVLVAAGRSKRMQLAEGERKPFLVLENRPLLEHCLTAFAHCPEIVEIVIVAQPEDLSRIERMALDNPLFSKLGAVVPGGAERVDSVREGLRATTCELVAIHDAARALIRSATISRAVQCAAARGAALVAVPVQDTIKRSRDGEHCNETLARAELWAAQTPQVFRREQLLELFERDCDTTPTDDAALYERWIGPIPIVPGESTNLKLTTPADLEIARALLRLRATQMDRP